MGNRRFVLLVIALGVMPLLVGCSLLDGGRALDILGDDNAIRQQLSQTADDVKGLPGVAAVENVYDYAAVATGGVGGPHQLQLTVEVGDRTDLALVAETVRLGFMDDRLAALSSELVVEAGGVVLLQQAVFDMSSHDLALDVAYRSRVSSTIGMQLTMRLGEPVFGDEDYSRVLASADPQVTGALIENYDAVLVIADSSTGSHSWDLPGVWLFGSLPGKEFMALLGELGEIVPLHPSSGGGPQHPSGGISLWGGNVPGWTTQPGFRMTLERDDPAIVVAVARLIADSGVVPTSLEYPTSDSYGAVHFGECANGAQEGQYDPGFIDELAEAGVPVTVAANLGLCAGSEQ